MRWLEQDDKRDAALWDANWISQAICLLLAMSKQKRTVLGDETYLYSGRKNRFDRLISMCAYLELMDDAVAGMKWVSSRAANLGIDLPRGGAVSVLNDAETGIPLLAYEGSAISLARTAGVAVVAISALRKEHPKSMVLIGCGRIHDWQARYARQLWPNITLAVYDTDIERKHEFAGKHDAVILTSWSAYLDADVISLATAGANSTGWLHYDSCKPKSSQIWLNTSLRDIQPSFVKHFPLVVVDDHGYAASQGTPYDFAWQAGWVKREMSLVDLLLRPPVVSPVLVNPMGLPLWDVGIGYLLYKLAFQEEKAKLYQEVEKLA